MLSCKSCFNSWILHESEAFMCKTFKGEAIVWLFRALNNAADESLRLAPWVKIDEKKFIIRFAIWVKWLIL